jgi:PAS domain S-box-containing protein
MKPDLVNAVLNSSTELAIIATCPEGVIQVFNRGAELMLGYSTDEMVNKMTPATFHDLNEMEAYSAVLSDKYKQAIIGFRVFVFEPERQGHECRMWTYIRKDGSRLTVNLTITPMKDEHNAIIGYMGIAQDITKIRSLESELMISDQRFSDAFHSATHGMGLVSIEGRWLDANAALCKIFGYEKNKLLLIDFQRITHPDDLERDLDLVNQLLCGKILSYQMEKRYFHSNGSLVYALLSVFLVRDTRGVPLYFVSQIQDLTLKKEIELKSEAGQRYLQLVLDAVADGIITLDKNLVIEKNNPGALRIFNLSQQEISDVSVLNFIAENDKQRFYCFCSEFLLEVKQASSRIEVEGVRLDLSTFELECHISSLIIDDDPKVVLVIRDITQRKRTDKMKSEFISTVSHELRTPLTAIKGALELISLGAVGNIDEKVSPIMDVAIRNTLRLSRLINDLLDIDKLASGKLELNLKEQRLMLIIDDAIALNSRFADEYNVRLELISGYDCWVNVDALRLHQIISNFISNAAKFSPLNSQVDISVTALDGYARVAVKDYGPGISEDFKSRLFTRFSQGDGSDRRRNSGTGLGLAITKELATAMNANVGCISKAKQGSTFYIDLPCKSAGQVRSISAHLREVI